MGRRGISEKAGVIRIRREVGVEVKGIKMVFKAV